MKHIITYSISILAVCSCGQSINDASNTIAVDRFAVSNPKKIDIDVIASHIDYIQLESIQESLISHIEKIQIKDDKIYVLDDMKRSIMVFDTSGKFIRQLGSTGRGPGEYIMPADFALCDSVILIRDNGQGKLILYDLNGRLIADKQVYASRIAFYKGAPVCEYNYPDFAFNNGFRISIFDRNLNLVAHILKSEIDLDETSARQYRMGHSRSFFANVNDTLTFWECRDDVVYKIIDENRIEKRFRFVHKNPAKFEDGMNKLEPGTSEIGSVGEARNHIFFNWYEKNEYNRLIYFKETGTYVCVDGIIKNSTGPDFFPTDNYSGLADDGKAYRLFSVYEYKNSLEKSKTPLENLDPKLQSLLQTCQVDDNPCIMLVTLK